VGGAALFRQRRHHQRSSQQVSFLRIPLFFFFVLTSLLGHMTNIDIIGNNLKRVTSVFLLFFVFRVRSVCADVVAALRKLIGAYTSAYRVNFALTPAATASDADKTVTRSHLAVKTPSGFGCKTPMTATARNAESRDA